MRGNQLNEWNVDARALVIKLSVDVHTNMPLTVAKQMETNTVYVLYCIVYSTRGQSSANN